MPFRAAEARYGLPRLGERAPAFEAVTTHGTVRLADYQGNWLVLLSHPADFTPVCTTETSRCVFDPGGVLRAKIYYPLTTGRNVDEILRLIDALQAADTHKVATAANRRPGEAVIVQAPVAAEQAAERADIAARTTVFKG